MQRVLNYFPNYPTHRLYFGEVETPYTQYNLGKLTKLYQKEINDYYYKGKGLWSDLRLCRRVWKTCVWLVVWLWGAITASARG